MASLLAGIQHNSSLVSLNVAGNKVNLGPPKMLRLVTTVYPVIKFSVSKR